MLFYSLHSDFAIIMDDQLLSFADWMGQSCRWCATKIEKATPNKEVVSQILKLRLPLMSALC